MNIHETRTAIRAAKGIEVWVSLGPDGSGCTVRISTYTAHQLLDNFEAECGNAEVLGWHNDDGTFFLGTGGPA